MLRFRIVVFIFAVVALGFLLRSYGKTGETSKTGCPGMALQEAKHALRLYRLGTEPDGIVPGMPMDVTFTIMVTGNTRPPKSIKLEKIEDVGELKDDGKGPDLQAGDRIYTGRFSVSADKDGKLYYCVLARHNGQEHFSEVCSIYVSSFPVGPAPSDPNSLVNDPITGQKLYLNEVLVAFVDGTRPQRIKEIVDAVKATVVGTIPSIGVFELRIQGDGTAAGVYTTIKALQTHKEVKYAEPNYAEQIDNEL